MSRFLSGQPGQRDTSLFFNELEKKIAGLERDRLGAAGTICPGENFPGTAIGTLSFCNPLN